MYQSAEKNSVIIHKYSNELSRPKSVDLGAKSPSRANLRSVIYKNILENSQTSRRKYSHSMLSSANSDNIMQNNNAISALKKLQKERLIISRLGFAEKARALDNQIEITREKAKLLREKEEKELLNEMMKILRKKNERKRQRVLDVLNQEQQMLVSELRKEKAKMMEKHKCEFLKIIDSTQRKSIGKIKKCDCKIGYLCKHNKSSSWNIRKPKPIVVLYRKNSKRLKQGGRNEDAIQIDEKADEIDFNDQIAWKNNIAKSIIQTPWGANVAIVDRMIEDHKKEMETLLLTHKFKQKSFKEKYENRMIAMDNYIKTEERRLVIKAKRIYEEKLKEKLRLEEKENDDVSNSLSDEDSYQNGETKPYNKNNDNDTNNDYDTNSDNDTNNDYDNDISDEEYQLDSSSNDEDFSNMDGYTPQDDIPLLPGINLKTFKIQNKDKMMNHLHIDKLDNDAKIVKNKVMFLVNNQIIDYVENNEPYDTTDYNEAIQQNMVFDIEVDIDYKNKTITPVLPSAVKPSFTGYRTKNLANRNV